MDGLARNISAADFMCSTVDIHREKFDVGKFTPDFIKDGMFPLRDTRQDIAGLVMLDKTDNLFDRVVSIGDIHHGAMLFGDII